MVTDPTRDWKRLPFSEYRLRPPEVLDEDEHKLEIAEVQAAAGRLGNAEWSAHELGVIITRVALHVAGGQMTKSLQCKAVVSGHALDRRFERVRAADRSHDAMKPPRAKTFTE